MLGVCNLSTYDTGKNALPKPPLVAYRHLLNLKDHSVIRAVLRGPREAYKVIANVDSHTARYVHIFKWVPHFVALSLAKGLGSRPLQIV